MTWREMRWLFFVVLLLGDGPAPARENLTGQWREEFEEDIRSVEQWDTRCGEAPQSPGRRDRGRTFTVEDRGVELRFSSPQESFPTSDCQSSHPGIRPREMTLKEGLYLKNCSTADDALDYESGLYSFRVISPEVIEYRETTRYSRASAGALCVHTRRVQRRYRRISAPAGEAGAEPPPAPTDAGPAVPAKAEAHEAAATDAGAPPDSQDPCRAPGPMRTLRVNPDRAQVLVGEVFCPRLEGRDDAGCPLPVRPEPTPAEPLPGVVWTPDGCLRVTERAPGGTRRIEIHSQGQRVTLQLVILRRLEPSTPRPHPLEMPPSTPSEASDGSEPLAEAPAADQVPPPSPPPMAPLTAQREAAPSPAPVQDSGDEPRWAWFAVAGAIALLLCTALFVGLRRRKKSRPALPATVPSPPQEVPLESLPTVQALPRAAARAPDAGTGRTFCTECGRALPAGARFCPFDRAPAPAVTEPPPAGPTCPSCGRTLPAGARFCPFDRTPLGKGPEK